MLFRLEESFITGEFLELIGDSGHIVTCYEETACTQKKCPVYGRKKTRCWQVVGTFCNDGRQAGHREKWADCRNCQVFKKSTATNEARIQELLNNIIFSISNYDSQGIKRVRLIKKHFVAFCQSYGLTGRQQEVLLLVLKNPTRKEMATALGVSIETVKMHLKHLYLKTKTHSHQELISRLIDFSAGRDSCCKSTHSNDSTADHICSTPRRNRIKS